MNIAIFSDTYFPSINGVTSSIFTLATELKNRGNTVCIVTISDFWSSGLTVEEGIWIYRLPSMPILFLKPNRAGWPLSFRVFLLMKKLKIDIIHSQTEFSMGFLALSIAMTLKLPLVHTYHTMYEDYTHYVAKGLIITPEGAKIYSKTFCNRAFSIVAPTPKTAASLLSYGVKRRIFVVPTGINLHPFLKDNYKVEMIQELKQKLNLSTSRPIVISIGRVAPEKSLDMMLEAMPKLVEKIPQVCWIVVGDGPAKFSLEKRAKELKLEKSVLFTGAVPYKNIGLYYQLGDVFVSCSTSETQGLTYYEAMAAGIPILAKQDESIEEVIVDGKTGRIFQAAKDIPEILSQILLDVPTRQRYAANAYKAALPYSSDIFAKRIEEVYHHTIDATRLKSSYQKKELLYLVPLTAFKKIIRKPSTLRSLPLIMKETETFENKRDTHMEAGIQLHTNIYGSNSSSEEDSTNGFGR